MLRWPATGPRSALGLTWDSKPFEADGDVLKLADGLPVDAARLGEARLRAVARAPKPRCGNAGDGAKALEEGSSSHVF